MVALMFLVGLPIIEILLLIQAGSAFGFWTPVIMVIGSAFLGIYLIRQQGLAAIRAAQVDRAAGEVPVAAILTGIRLAFAGILMIIPGFLTDVIGLALLIPGVSIGVIKVAERSGSFRFANRHNPFEGGANYGPGAQGPYDSLGDTIDAEFEVVSDGKPPAAKPDNHGSEALDQPPRRLPRDTSGQ